MLPEFFDHFPHVSRQNLLKQWRALQNSEKIMTPDEIDGESRIRSIR